MKTKKKFIVVAYDVTDDKRRRKVVKTLFRYGATRVNFSVMEITITDRNIQDLKTDIETIISMKEDTVIFYPLDLNCFAQILYLHKGKLDSSYDKVRTI